MDDDITTEEWEHIEYAVQEMINVINEVDVDFMLDYMHNNYPGTYQELMQALFAREFNNL